MNGLPFVPSVNFPRLNNAEYLYLITRILERAYRATAQAIGVSEVLLLELRENIDKMVAISAVTHASGQTTVLHDLDTKRKDLLIHILSAIRTSCKLPIPALSHAANALYLSTKKYTGIQTLPHNQETQQIVNLQKDLEEAENAAHMLTLGLKTVADELFKTNDEYLEHSKERSDDVAEKDLGSCSDIRLITDKQCNYLITMANAFVLAVPSDEATKFVESMNILIKETKTAYNQRTAQLHSHKEEDVIIPEEV